MKLLPGFKPVYRYTVRDGRVINAKAIPSPLCDQRGVVYAHVSGGEVLYIGKTDGKLSSRTLSHANY